jgi:hypothetical protein
VCCAVMLASACGGGTSATSAVSASPSTASPGAGTGGGAGAGSDGGAGGAQRGFPGATGLLAAIDGTTLQVQSTSSQTAVTYTPATTFTNTVAARGSAVVVGSCVQARSTPPAAAAGGATPTPRPSAARGPIVAASVDITAAVNGQCSAFGGLRAPGGRPPGAAAGGTRPSGAPVPNGTRGPGAGRNGFGGGGGFGAFGKVTAVSGTGFTVVSSRPPNSAGTSAATTTVTVKTSAATKYTRTQAANAKALAVGLCVTALGKASDTGSIAAVAITLRPAVNGSCSTGFGRRGAGSFPAAGGADA